MYIYVYIYIYPYPYPYLDFLGVDLRNVSQTWRFEPERPPPSAQDHGSPEVHPVCSDHMYSIYENMCI